MIRISEIVDRVAEYAPEANLDIINRAYVFSAQKHAGQVRLSGEPYLSHPLEVAGILAEMKLDPESIAAGLLHDILEDTETTATELEQLFGPDVVRIVSAVSKMSKVDISNKEQRQAESIRRMLLAMADDIRVIMIKLADRLHNMRTLEYQKPEKRAPISQETIDIYASIATRLGIYWIKNELEELAFKYSNPTEYERIEKLVAQSEKIRDKYVETVRDYIKKKMGENDFNCDVLGRNKTYFSIYHKMIDQSLPFEEIYDIIAFRIILDSVPHCYAALGLIHTMWKPIDHKFKDYIARPKANSYQSLHTTVIGPLGRRIEIQIRTREMDRVAKSGIAAHWSYKEGRQIDDETRAKMVWLQNLLENQEYVQDAGEFMENVRLDLFPDDVYVFTPKGDVKTLPTSSTPVDFAYMVHTEVGNQTVGAKVNGLIVPLHHQLKTGDIVEIITSKNHRPSKDWLKFVKTVKARAKIKSLIKSEDKERSLTLGHDLMVKAFRRHKQNFDALLKAAENKALVAEVVDAFGFKALDDLIEHVGYGKITPLQVYRKFFPAEAKDEKEFDDIGDSKKSSATLNAIMVGGLNDVLVRFGNCCNPIPGDHVVGYITRGYGVTVHRDTCHNVRGNSSERIVSVAWSPKASDATFYPIKISITSQDRVGLLADISTLISREGGNITKVQSETHDSEMVQSLLNLKVKDTAHLDKIMNSLRHIKNVQRVERIS